MDSEKYFRGFRPFSVHRSIGLRGALALPRGTTAVTRVSGWSCMAGLRLLGSQCLEVVGRRPSRQGWKSRLAATPAYPPLGAAMMMPNQQPERRLAAKGQRPVDRYCSMPSEKWSYATAGLLPASLRFSKACRPRVAGSDPMPWPIRAGGRAASVAAVGSERAPQ